MKKCLLVLLYVPLFSMAQETLWLKSPSVSADKIAFAYDGNVWVADKDGSHPQQLTVRQSIESTPLLSPNGKWIAFTGVYDNNADVYVIPSAGGNPRRLTFHPAADKVRSWDGNDNIVFSSLRESVHLLQTRLFEVDISSGKEQALPMPQASQGSVSPDRTLTAYNQSIDVNEWAAFRLYRGGDMARIWIFNNKTHDIEEIPSGHSNNLSPVWVNTGFIYFLSDRDDHYVNIYKYSLKTKEILAVTSYKDFDVKSLYSNGNQLAYEQAGRIFTLDPADDRSTHIPVHIQTDLPSRRPYFADAGDNIYNINISPTGLRAVAEARGEILTIPAEKGDIRNLTNSPGTNERDPAWSNDGKYIAYFSDEGGEYQLKIIDQKGEHRASSIALNDEDFYYHPIWSPDSKMIAFTDKQRKLYIVNIADKKLTEIDQDLYTLGSPQVNYSWSADSKWLAYNNRLNTNLSAIFLYDVASKSKHQVTDARSEAACPVFSRDGKYLFFTASANYGPAQSWFDLSSKHYNVLANIYALVLAKSTPSILQPESDEEAVVVEKNESSTKTPAIVVDFDHIEQRTTALPIPAKNFSSLDVGIDGHLYYLAQDYMATDYNLMDYVISKRTSNEVMKGINAYVISNDGKKMLYSAPNNVYGIVSVPGKTNPGDGALQTNELKVYVDPVKEWEQMYNEVWRLERDFLYVKNTNGADLTALKKKYAVFLPYIANRYDLNSLFNQMLGELVLGHVFVRGGDFPKSNTVTVGLLGADYEADHGYYRFKKIYSGLNWNPDLTAPLTQPGIDVKDGQYLVSVNGVPLTDKSNLYSLFQNTAGKQTLISINSSPTTTGAKDFTVIPIANEMKLRLMNWVEDNRKKVDSLSGGKIAYAYLPNTANDGYDFFNRYFFSQLDKQAIIVDDRDNTGGYAADYIVDLLDRKTLLYGNKRDGKPFSIPNGVINGPKVMIINSHALSGGDLLPYMFRAKHTGLIVGTTTFGILVGITGNPNLLDGGYITTPNFGVFGASGQWIIEQQGVVPDVEVDNYPGDVINGKDAQLEKTVELILRDLKPVKPMEQPTDPVRVAN
jgi:tricorn protease